MPRLIGLGFLVSGLLIAGCGSSAPRGTGGTSAASTAGTAGVTGSGTSSGETTGSGGSATGAGSSGSTGGLSGSVSTLAGSGLMNGMCGAWGKDAVFSPSMLALDGARNVYVSSDTLDEISPSGALTQLVSLTFPLSGMAVTPTGALFYSASTVSHSSDTLIAQVIDGAATTIFYQGASCDDTGSDAGAPGLGEPAGIAVDPEENLYVADEACFRVRELALDGGIISTLAGTGDQGDKDGPGSMAEFSQLAAIAIDPNGNIYVAESDTGRIREIQPDGTTSTLASFIFAVGGLAADSSGNVYFSSSMANTIRKIDPSGHVTTIAGNGMMGYMDGPSASAEFNSPAGIAVDDQGNIYVADSANCYVRVISPGK